MTRLRAQHSPGFSIEFVSTLVSGQLSSDDRQDGESKPEGKSAGSDGVMPVAVLDGDCIIPTREVGRYTECHAGVGGAKGRILAKSKQGNVKCSVLSSHVTAMK